jgi:hypothetical protein
MKKFWKNKKGTVSLFLLIMLTAIFFFNAVLIDYARILAAHLQAERALGAANRSILSVYDRELQEKYGIYGTNIFKDANLNTMLKNVVDRNVTVPSGGKSDFLNMKVEGTEFNGKEDPALSLADRNVFTMQVLDDMKYKGPLEFSLAMLDPLSDMASKLKSNSSETKAIDGMEKDNKIIQDAIDKLKLGIDDIEKEYESTSLTPKFISYAVSKGFRMNYTTKLPIAPIVTYVLLYMRAQIYLQYLDLVNKAETDNLAEVAQDPDLKESINTYLGMYLIAKRWIEDAGVSYGNIQTKLKELTASQADLDKAIAASKRIDEHNAGRDPYNTRQNEAAYDKAAQAADERKKDTKSIVGDKLKAGFFGSCSSCGQSVKEAQDKLNAMMEKKKKEVAGGGPSQVTKDLEQIKAGLKDAATAVSNLKTRADEWKGPIVDGGKPVREDQEPFNFSGSKEMLETAKKQIESKIATLLQASNPVDFKVENSPADTFDAQKLKDYVSFMQLIGFASGFEQSLELVKDTADKLKRESDEARKERSAVMSMFNSVSNCFDDLFNLGQFASSTANYQSFLSKYNKMAGMHDKFAGATSGVSLEEIKEGDDPSGIAKQGGDMLDEKMVSIAANLDSGDNLLINEYALLRMKTGDIAKTDYTTYNLLFDEEVEYVIQGSHTPGNNYKAVMAYTYLMRLGLNFAHMIVDKQYAPIRAIPFGIGYIILLVLAIFDSFMDMACLKQGERIPLYKGFPELGWKYKDYLRFFLGTQTNKEEKINRLQSIIQVKDPRYDLYSKYTRIDTKVDLSMKLWFLPQVFKWLNYGGDTSKVEGNRYKLSKEMQLSY